MEKGEKHGEGKCPETTNQNLARKAPFWFFLFPSLDSRGLLKRKTEEKQNSRRGRFPDFLRGIVIGCHRERNERSTIGVQTIADWTCLTRTLLAKSVWSWISGTEHR